MSSFLHTIGLARSPTGQEPLLRPGTILVTHILFTYLFTQPRLQRIAYGIDDNIQPRDPSKRASSAEKSAVDKGQISSSQIDRINRLQAAHNNTLENAPIFYAAFLFALVARLPNTYVNRFGAFYLTCRLAYVLNYYYTETSEMASQARTLLWWAGNLSCISTIVRAANRWL